MTLLRTLIASAGLALGGMAQATVFYDTSFDPTYPVAFAGVGRFGIEDGCLLMNDGWYANAAGCLVTLNSATVHITGQTPDPLDVTFAPPIISSSSLIRGIYVSGGELQGVDSALLFYVGAAPFTNDPWWLEFISGHEPTSVASINSTASTNVVNLYSGSCDEDFRAESSLRANVVESPCRPDRNHPSSATDVTYTRVAAVPEPATLLLLLGALGGGLLSRRRRFRA